MSETSSDASDQIAARLVAPVGDDDPALRPCTLADFIGQAKVCKQLLTCLQGARRRHEALDHTLLYGPPGLGKTTLSQIIAKEMQGGFRAVAAPSIQRPGDLASILVSLQPHDVLFIDEIHRLPPNVEEILYSPMEDFSLSIMTGDPGRLTPMTLDLPRFTLVGATTRSGMLTRPLRDRFGITLKLDLYSTEDLAGVIRRSAGLLGIDLADQVDMSISRRSRGTPRIANKLLKRLRDYIPHEIDEYLSLEVANQAFLELEVDDDGLDSLDRRYLDALQSRFHGRAVGLETLAAALGEDAGTLENEVEPWLLMQGFIDRTPRGRILGAAAEVLFADHKQSILL